MSEATLTRMITPISPAWTEFFVEKAIGHSGANARWFYFPESNHTLYMALHRMDFPSAEPVVDSGAVRTVWDSAQRIRPQPR